MEKSPSVSASKSTQRRLAAMRGEPAPEFGAARPKPPVYAAAIDPGLRHSGVACVEWDHTSKPKVLLATVITPAATKRWEILEEMVDRCVESTRLCYARYDIVAVENYVAFAARSWNAHDTLMVLGALVQREKWAGTGARIYPVATAQVVRKWLTQRARMQGRTISVSKADGAIASEVESMVEWACAKPPVSVLNHAIDAIALSLYAIANLQRNLSVT